MSKQVISNSKEKVFGLWSAVFLGIGSMVGAGIFIVIGEAGMIAGNLVMVSFFIGGIIALLCGYSLSKLAICYPSRGVLLNISCRVMERGFFQDHWGFCFILHSLFR